MPTQKVENNSVRKLIKLGKGSLVVSLPAGVVNSLKWREKQKVVVKKIHGGVQIKDWRVRPTRPSKLQRSGKHRAGGKK